LVLESAPEAVTALRHVLAAQVDAQAPQKEFAISLNLL
jgi:hypothetical protein